MAIVCLTGLGALPTDIHGSVAPVVPRILGEPHINDDFAASADWSPPAGTRIFRLATDVPIHLNRTGSGDPADDTHEWFPAGDYYLELPRGVGTVSYIAAA